MTALVALVVLNLALWCIAIGVALGYYAAHMPERRRRAQQATTHEVGTRVWIPRSSDRATKIGREA